MRGDLSAIGLTALGDPEAIRAKEAFDREIENGPFEGRPKLTVEHLIEEGSTVVA